MSALGVAGEVLSKAMVSPYYQISANAGVIHQVTPDYEYGFGLNVKTNEVGNMYKMGVIDPAKVTKNALKNAVSVATTILTTNAIVTIKR